MGVPCLAINDTIINTEAQNKKDWIFMTDGQRASLKVQRIYKLQLDPVIELVWSSFVNLTN